MKKGESLSCCIKDESRPLSFGDQKSELNHPMRLFVKSNGRERLAHINNIPLNLTKIKLRGLCKLLIFYIGD